MKSSNWLIQRKVIVCLFVLCFLSMIFVFKSFASSITNTWYSGNTIVTLSSDGVLNVTAKQGTDGRMSDFKYTGKDWNTPSIKSNYTSVIVDSTVTYIGKYAFNGDSHTIAIPYDIEIQGSPQFSQSWAHSITFGNVKCDLSSTLGNGSLITLKDGTLNVIKSLKGADNIDIPNYWGRLCKNVLFNNESVECFYGSLLQGATLNELIIPGNVVSIEGEIAAQKLSKMIILASNNPKLTFSLNSKIHKSLESLEVYRDTDFVNTDDFGNKTIIGEGVSVNHSWYGNNSGQLFDLYIMDGGHYMESNTPSGIQNINSMHLGIGAEASVEWSQQYEAKIDKLILDEGSALSFNAKLGVVPVNLKLSDNVTVTRATIYGKNIADTTPITIPVNFNGNLSGFVIKTLMAPVWLGSSTMYTNILENNDILLKFDKGQKLTNDGGLPGNVKNLLLLDNLDVSLSKYQDLEKLYLLGNINGKLTKLDIPTTAMVYCIKDSSIATWCKNNLVAYTILTDEEVDALINGSLPTLVKDSFMFDGDIVNDISITVNLGEKPAGASGIKKVLVDNETIPVDNWLFNGTDKVTISSDYLSTLTNGSHAVSILFYNETFRSGATITVINSTQGNSNSKPPEALVTITYEFYKDYPDFVIVPVKMNGATGITRLRIGSNEIDPVNYKLEDGAIILDKDLLSTLDAGKYRVLPTFNDKDKTTITNIQLIVYNNAADRAAPYLLQSRVVFDNSPVVLRFDSGAGDLTATNVLALILDDDVILPNGEILPFTKSNVVKVQKAYDEALNIDEPYDNEVNVATSSNASESTVATSSNASEVATSSNATYTSFSNVCSTKVNKFSLFANKKKTDEPSQLAMVMADLEYGNNNVFSVDGNEITLDADYVNSLNLTEGDHLIGAIFDNTERTTDVKKVILTIPSSGGSIEPTPDPDTQ